MAKPIAERGNAPFSKTPEASKASFCLGLSNCRSDGGLSFGARWAHTEVCNHWAPKLKRRINGDFTGQAGVGKIDNVNFSVGGKTPCLKITVQNCGAILLTIPNSTSPPLSSTPRATAHQTPEAPPNPTPIRCPRALPQPCAPAPSSRTPPARFLSHSRAGFFPF